MKKHIKLTGILAVLLACGLSACSSAPKKMNVSAPMPPVTNVEIGMTDLGSIQPASGPVLAMKEQSLGQKSCRFSSMQRKHAIGFEFDEQTHLGLRTSPDIDIWNPTDLDMKVQLTFTKAIGGAAKKRPKCTFDGFYGFLPYATNKGINFEGIKNPTNIKSYVKEKLEVREQRRKAREDKRGKLI